MKKYPKTPQQKKVKIGGEFIKRFCKGKKGEEFVQCRTIVLKCAFNDEECDEELLEEKKKIIKKLES